MLLHRRNSEKAMRAVAALRSASSSLAFNQLLQDLARRCAPRSLHSGGIWQCIAAERTTLITDEEAPSVGVGAAAASAFLQQHGVKQQVCCCLHACTLLVRAFC